MEKISATIQGVRYLWQFRTPKRELTKELEAVLSLPPLVAFILAVRQISSLSQARDSIHGFAICLPHPPFRI